VRHVHLVHHPVLEEEEAQREGDLPQLPPETRVLQVLLLLRPPRLPALVGVHSDAALVAEPLDPIVIVLDRPEKGTRVREGIWLFLKKR
jgi:hypothetical protein